MLLREHKKGLQQGVARWLTQFCPKLTFFASKNVHFQTPRLDMEMIRAQQLSNTKVGQIECMWILRYHTHIPTKNMLRTQTKGLVPNVRVI